VNYDELIAAGFDHEEAMAWLAQNGGAPAATAELQPAQADGSAVQLSDGEQLAAAGALGAGGLYFGGKAAKSGVASHTAKRQLRRAVYEATGTRHKGAAVQELIRRIQAFEATGRGGDVTLSDLDPRLSAEADYAATNNPRTRTELSQLHTERRRAQPQRLQADVARIVPEGYSDAEGIRGQLQQGQQAFARGPQGFEGLRQANPMFSPQAAQRLGQFVDQPFVDHLWNEAVKVGMVGPKPPADALSFEVLQNFKESLDGLAQSAFQTNGALGRRIADARDELVSILSEEIPEYGKVSGVYSQYGKLDSAVELGQQAYRDASMQLPELDRRLSQLSAGERKLFERGILGAYLADIENARKNASFFETFQARLPVVERKLELIFGGPEQAAQALEAFEQELSIGRLGEVVGGSQTARRGAQQASTAAEAGADAAHIAMSPMTGIPEVGRKRIARWMPGAVAEKMRPAVTARGSTALEELLRTLMKVR
jgi:hypothetical protein